MKRQFSKNGLGRFTTLDVGCQPGCGNSRSCASSLTSVFHTLSGVLFLICLNVRSPMSARAKLLLAAVKQLYFTRVEKTEPRKKIPLPCQAMRGGGGPTAVFS